MKYTIEGFSQSRLVELKLDVMDAILLRFFIDFKDTGKMVKEIIEGETYYWFKYDHVLKELPILGLKKDTVYRRLKKMSEIGVLKHKTVKRAGTYSFYTTGEQYKTFILDELSDINPTGYGIESERGTDLNPEQNINLQEDSSTKDIEDKPLPSKKKDNLISYDELGLVKLTKEQYDKLCSEYNIEFVTNLIENMSLYLGQNNKKPYKNSYLALLKWAKNSKNKPQPKTITTSSNTPKEIIKYVFDPATKTRITIEYALSHNIDYIEAPEA